jgi:cytochrome c-type biogenesis protein CcmH/NrfG
MAKPVKQPSADLKAYMRKETALLIALGALALGFFGGVFFGVYKSGPTVKGGMGAGAPTAAAPRDLQDQITGLEAETRRNPANAAAWIELGNAYFDADQTKKSIEAYRKALEVQPNNADVVTDMGVMLRKDGKPKEAVEAFDRAIAINPKHEIARLNKGIVLLHDLQDGPGALRAWDGLLEVNPTFIAPGGMSLDQMVQGLKKQMAEKK